MTSHFLPEGRLLSTAENQAALSSPAALRRCMEEGRIIEGTALLCDPDHNLTVAVGPWTGFIPREEAALGIAEGTTRDIAILSRVGKSVACVVTGMEEWEDGSLRPILSRRLAQEQALGYMMEHIRSGMVIPALVSHLEPFGAFVDVGCGVASMIGIENISVSRIPHPKCRFSPGQEILAAVLDVDRSRRRIYLTHKELLGTWAENAARFKAGATVPGVVRGVKDYGLFVELTPNLSGLAELRPGIGEGDRVSVYIKAILPERMKIKLLAIDKLPPAAPEPLQYFITEGPIGKWKYAPEGCVKLGAETIFAG